MNTQNQEIGQGYDPLEDHRDKLGKMSALIDTMPSLKDIAEHWTYYLIWKGWRGMNEPVPLSLEEALSIHSEKHLAEFFQFWLGIQRAYLAALTIEGEAEIKAQFDKE